MPKSDGDLNMKRLEDEVRRVRDLSDFCLSWADIQPIISDSVLERSGLSAEQIQTIQWMRHLTDRVTSMPSE